MSQCSEQVSQPPFWHRVQNQMNDQIFCSPEWTFCHHLVTAAIAAPSGLATRALARAHVSFRMSPASARLFVLMTTLSKPQLPKETPLINLVNTASDNWLVG